MFGQPRERKTPAIRTSALVTTGGIRVPGSSRGGPRREETRRTIVVIWQAKQAQSPAWNVVAAERSAGMRSPKFSSEAIRMSGGCGRGAARFDLSPISEYFFTAIRRWFSDGLSWCAEMRHARGRGGAAFENTS